MADKRLTRPAIRYIAEERQRERAAIRAFCDAAHRGDAKAFIVAMTSIDEDMPHKWCASMKAVSRTPCPRKFRRFFLRLYLRGGDHIRQEVGNDIIFIDALKCLLPPYRGLPKLLYRGEGALNRRNRAYGLAWTTSCEIARAHACGLWQRSRGGSVLLQAYAPAAAIICAPSLLDDRYAEQEYVIDRRRLAKIRVLERFPQVAPFSSSATRRGV
jgi:hypothetical protein